MTELKDDKESSRIKLFIPLIILLVITPFLFIGLNLDPNRVPSVLEGKMLPSFSLPVLSEEGEAVEIATEKDVLGEPFLLNVWATWCYVCRVEHPYLLKLANQGVKIVGLNWKDEKPKAIEWLAALGNPYSLNLIDVDGRLVLDLGVYGAPETFVVSGSGAVLYRHAGEVNERVWKEKFEPLMVGN